MKYLVLLMGPGEMPAWEDLSPEEIGAAMAKFGAFDETCAQRDGVQILSGESLGPAESSTVVRTRGGERTLTDGPYAEAVEQLGGFYLIEAPDLDVLLEVLEVLPPFDLQITPVDTSEGADGA